MPQRIAPAGYASTELWAAFSAWCDNNGVGDDADDWQPWWECFLEGHTIALRTLTNPEAVKE